MMAELKEILSHKNVEITKSYIGNTEREQTTLRLPAELKEQLQKEASVKGISLNGYILFLINVGRCSLNK